jgi:hypothetical protein
MNGLRQGSRTSRVRTTLAGLLVFTLLASACGDDSEAAADDPTTTTTTAPDDPETTTPDDPETSEPATTEAPETLPASFRGVTETSIKVGVAVPDFEALQAAGVSNYQGDAQIAFQAFFDAINNNGGIFGRQIEPVFVGFNFVDPLTQDVACAELTGDHEVFIVLYGLLGEGNLCLTELNDTMVMTRSFQTTDLVERSDDTLWLQLNAGDDSRVRILAGAMAESGRLDGKTIGILGGATATDDEALEEALTALGFDSLRLETTADRTDPAAVERELGIVAEQFSSAGVDFLFELRGGGDAVGILAAEGFTPEIAYKALGASIDGATDPSLLDGAVGVSEINEDAFFMREGFQTNCMDVVRAANPDLVEEMAFIPTGEEQAAGQPSWPNPVMIACDQTKLLKLIGEIAGAELTNDSFRAALDDLGPVVLDGYGQASFRSEDKWDGLDEFFLQIYDAETDSITIGDPIVVDR